MTDNHNKSLLKYNNPVSVRRSENETPDQTVAAAVPDRASSNDRGVDRTEDILNSMFKPREWTKDGELWIQRVSSTPATRLEVTSLRDALDRGLKERRANETGICSVREGLYAEAFDEIIRQVTIGCSDRGKLLLRLRDELRMTNEAYRNLYESSIAFGIRKALVARHEKEDLTAQIGKMSAEKEDLERQVEQLANQISNVQKKESTRRDEEKARHEEEINKYKEKNRRIQETLERFLAKGQNEAEFETLTQKLGSEQ